MSRDENRIPLLDAYAVYRRLVLLMNHVSKPDRMSVFIEVCLLYLFVFIFEVWNKEDDEMRIAHISHSEDDYALSCGGFTWRFAASHLPSP